MYARAHPTRLSTLAADAPRSQAASRKRSRIRGGCSGEATAAATGLAVRGVTLCLLGKLGSDNVRTYTIETRAKPGKEEKNRHLDRPRRRSSNGVQIARWRKILCRQPQIARRRP